MPAKLPPSTSQHTRKYTAKRFEKICHEIANSNKGLAKICHRFGIATSTFYSWLKADKKLAEQYAEAREMQADFLADEIIEIAEDDSKDILTDPVTGRQQINFANIHRSRLRIEARKWRIAILSPKKYSNKKTIEVPVISEPILIDWTADAYKNARKEDIKVIGTTFEELMQREL